ncbi:uncharacterized protein LOC108105355 [Drosophila eugracilis]|uniref:uncharacterized protein LOC108105355 n=1 Tax=Drosophila eugracilis TaxID=29029 RepID=UPI0007E7C484|nr:uncharacterized protein LOC108105355 [Drosophila eugracilis]
MKVINLCLLIVASASFILTTANANALGNYEKFDALEALAALDTFTDAELEEMIAYELNAMEEEFMGVEEFGFINDCRKILWAGYKGINGTKCIVEEVGILLLTCTGYVDDLATCTGNIPTDVKAILSNAKQIIVKSQKILNLDEICASSSRGVVSATKSFLRCTLKLFYATMSIVRNMNVMIKDGHALPFKTAACYVDATNKVVDGCNAFVPNVKTCIASMT